MTKEIEIEHSLITKLTDLKYFYRLDIRDRDTLELNFRQMFGGIEEGIRTKLLRTTKLTL